MEGNESGLGSTFAKLTTISKIGLDKAKEAVVQSSQTARIRIDIISLQQERKKLLIELAGDLIDAIESKKLETDLFNDILTNISDLDEKVVEKQVELQKVGIDPSDIDQETEEKSRPVEPATSKEEE